MPAATRNCHRLIGDAFGNFMQAGRRLFFDISVIALCLRGQPCDIDRVKLQDQVISRRHHILYKPHRPAEERASRN
jgi:hypothetical protein